MTSKRCSVQETATSSPKPWSGTDRLDKQAKPRVVTGIEAGARKIRDYLKHRYGPASRQTLPVGLGRSASAPLAG
jgi:hypothetical protein